MYHKNMACLNDNALTETFVVRETTCQFGHTDDYIIPGDANQFPRVTNLFFLNFILYMLLERPIFPWINDWLRVFL